MAEESKCVMCLTGKHPQWGEVEPAKMIDIRGEKRMRHEHTRDHMFTSLCVAEPAPDPQEPPKDTVQSTDAAPQTSAEQIIIAKGLGVIVPLDRYNELIDAQRQIECLKNPPPALLQVVSKYLEHGLTVSHAESAVILCDLLSKFAEAKYVQPAAPQPVSRDAPHKIKVGKYPPMSAQEKLNHAAELYADLAQREGSEQDRDAAAMLQELAGDAPKVEEIARQLSQKFGFHSSRVLTYEGALGFLRPYFPPASQTPPISEHVLNEIVLAVCEIPDRTSPDDFPEAMIVTPEELRFIIRDKFEQAATPASTARTDALLNLLRAADDVLAEQSLINQRFTQKQDALFAELMGWRDANGILAAPGSVPQTPDSPNKPHCQNCGCNHFRGENTLCNDGVPQAEPPKERTITLAALWHLLFPEGTEGLDFVHNDVGEWLDHYTEEIECHAKRIALAGAAQPGDDKPEGQK